MEYKGNGKRNIKLLDDYILNLFYAFDERREDIDKLFLSNPAEYYRQKDKMIAESNLNTKKEPWKC